jgi:ESCRT-I complex subunit VPS37
MLPPHFSPTNIQCLRACLLCPMQALERLREESRELATANLARGEEQADIRNQQAIIRSSEYAPAKAAFDEKWGRQQGVLAKLSPEVLMRR